MRRESIELEPLFVLPSSYKKARYFYTQVFPEVALSRNFLTDDEAAFFAWYYGSQDRGRNVQRGHFCHRHAQRVQHLVEVVNGEPEILDAGCGLGSESILCGVLGAKVVGVDTDQNSVNIATKRLRFYEGLLGRKITVEFGARSVFDVQNSFDVIWSLESISHIDPAERFIAYAHDHLKDGGKLIISDPNKLNPLIYWTTRKARKSVGGATIEVNNPHTGEMISWAVERVFNVLSIKKLLLNNGFVIDSFHYSGLLPYLPGLNIRQKNVSLYLEKLMDPIWPKLLSGIYTVVASKS